MNKTIAIRQHLEEQGSITSLQAIQLYGATRLSAIIYNLRRRGMLITADRTVGIDKYGNRVAYATYRYTVPIGN